MPSTVIKRFDYRPETCELEVLFVTGRRYLYADVPPDEAEGFRAAFAKGVYFNRRIRDRIAARSWPARPDGKIRPVQSFSNVNSRMCVLSARIHFASVINGP